MKAKTKSAYRKRLIKVIDHIYANIAAEFDVFELPTEFVAYLPNQ